MPNRRKGLTLIEILIIIVMIGILLTIGFEKIRGRSTNDIVVALKQDIESAKAGESKYFAAHNAYGNQFQLDSAQLLVVSPGNAVAVVPTPTGYTATVKYDAEPSRKLRCVVVVSGGEEAAAKARANCS